MAGIPENHLRGQARIQPTSQRLDKWLWFARLLKSRTLAAQLVQAGKVRVNRARTTKPSQTVRPGDVLTIALSGKVHVVKLLAAGERRGPPPEAQRLYEVITRTGGTSDTMQRAVGSAQRDRGAARPTKRDRRQIDRFTEQD